MSNTETMPGQEVAEPVVQHNFWPSDSTSIHEVQILLEQDQGSALGEVGLFDRVQSLVDLEEDQWGDQNLDEVVTELLKFYRSTNHFFTGSDAIRTKYLVMLGLALRQVKKIVQDRGSKWEEWVTARMGSQVRRSVGDYMRLAGIKKILDYVFLGKARLMKIATAVNDEIKRGDVDPVGDFLRTSNITFDPREDQGISLETIQVEIDAELMRRRLVKEELPDIDTNKLKDMAETKINLTSDIVRALKQEVASDGDTSLLLGNIVNNKGKLPDEYQKALKPEHFASRSESLKKSVEDIIGNEELLSAVDIAAVESLIDSLTTLKSKIQAVATTEDNQEEDN